MGAASSAAQLCWHPGCPQDVTRAGGAVTSPRAIVLAFPKQSRSKLKCEKDAGALLHPLAPPVVCSFLSGWTWPGLSLGRGSIANSSSIPTGLHLFSACWAPGEVLEKLQVTVLSWEDLGNSRLIPALSTVISTSWHIYASLLSLSVAHSFGMGWVAEPQL